MAERSSLAGPRRLFDLVLLTISLMKDADDFFFLRFFSDRGYSVRWVVDPARVLLRLRLSVPVRKLEAFDGRGRSEGMDDLKALCLFDGTGWNDAWLAISYCQPSEGKCGSALQAWANRRRFAPEDDACLMNLRTA